MPNNTSLLPETKIQRSDENYLSSTIGQEVVMMNLDTGDYLGLNAVAKDIWDYLENPVTVSDLTDHLVTLYDTDKDTAHAEIEKFLQRLLDKQMLIIVE